MSMYIYNDQKDSDLHLQFFFILVLLLVIKNINLEKIKNKFVPIENTS